MRIILILLDKLFIVLYNRLRRQGKAMNYSRQRETVLSVLRATKEHPSADDIYGECKKVMPGIGLATVYRNLEQLVASGQAIKVPVGQDRYRYDADTSLHCHGACPVCGRVWDEEVSSSLNDALLKECENNESECYSLTFFKVCGECKAKQEQR